MHRDTVAVLLFLIYGGFAPVIIDNEYPRYSVCITSLLYTGTDTFFQCFWCDGGATMSFSTTLRSSARLTLTTYLTRPTTRLLSPPCTTQNHQFQVLNCSFSSTPRVKMPESNNPDLVISNLFDVKGKVSLYLLFLYICSSNVICTSCALIAAIDQ